MSSRYSLLTYVRENRLIESIKRPIKIKIKQQHKNTKHDYTKFNVPCTRIVIDTWNDGQNNNIVNVTKWFKNISVYKLALYKSRLKIILSIAVVQIRRIMLPQIFISSIQQICLWFFFIMSFSDDARFSASDSLVKQIGQSALIFSVQIFIACYVFGNLHDQKDSIIFALYSSNWSEMNMKCKKLILLTMKMNNANHKKFKFTTTRVVNLEMFFK
ncbi:hypothetical protein ACI65C_007219, partial [Semiaphis heraclei]